MTTPILTLTGKPLQEKEQYDNPKYINNEETPKEQPTLVRDKIITLRDVCIGSLFGQIDSDKGVSGVQKNKWFCLAINLQTNDKPDLKSEDITLLKNRIGKLYSILIIGRSFEILDPDDQIEKKTKIKENQSGKSE